MYRWFELASNRMSHVSGIPVQAFIARNNAAAFAKLKSESASNAVRRALLVVLSVRLYVVIGGYGDVLLNFVYVAVLPLTHNLLCIL